MNCDSKVPVVAKVDLSKVSLGEKKNLGIDFFNEIDIWAKMEFRFREQINKLRRNETLNGPGDCKYLESLHYSVREKFD